VTFFTYNALWEASLHRVKQSDIVHKHFFNDLLFVIQAIVVSIVVMR